MSRVLSSAFASANSFVFGMSCASVAYCGYTFLTTGANFWPHLVGIGLGSLIALYEFILAHEEGLI